MMWIYVAIVSAWLSGALLGYGIAKDSAEVLEDRFDMTGVREKEHLITIAPYDGVR